jgi:hypothetical protein
VVDSTNRLLVIDDQQELCDYVVEVAHGLEFDARSVTQAQAFRETYLEFNPTVVVLDLQMPNVDGIELLRYLGAQRAHAQVLVASGMDQRVLNTADQVGQSLGLNMLGALQKPFMLTDLEKVLRKAKRESAAINEADLERAIKNQEVQVYYQPKARLINGEWRIEGVEALARWHHPHYGFIPPPEFIGLAEKTGQIRPLTEQIIERCFKQSAHWIAAGHQLQMSINLSAHLLNDRQFPDYLTALATQYTVPAQMITFEVTETAIMADPDASMDVLTRIRLKNFGLSIDDFGTGYASLKQLYQMPFSELKIDMSFVRDVCQRAEARIMVETMVLLAHKLGMTACAEGVETNAELDFLQHAGCDHVQGYLLGKPMPSEELMSTVAAWNNKLTTDYAA